MTTFPPAPDFTSDKHELIKFGGCMTSKLTRFFTVDHENLMQYETKQAPNVKKTLKLADAKSFVEEKSEHRSKYKNKSIPKKEEWIDPNKEFRVGMRLKDRKMEPIFFYSKDLHDAKFLYANIELYGD
jgi:glycerol-3-phosphate dehydrogenase